MLDRSSAMRHNMDTGLPPPSILSLGHKNQLWSSPWCHMQRCPPSNPGCASWWLNLTRKSDTPAPLRDSSGNPPKTCITLTKEWLHCRALMLQIRRLYLTMNRRGKRKKKKKTHNMQVRLQTKNILPVLLQLY